MKGLIFNIQRYSLHDGSGIRTIIFLKGCPLKCPWCANPESRLAVKPTEWVKNGRRETVGAWRTVADLVDEVMKDEIFFRTSGGGVTLSGGEVLMQAEFACELLREFQELGVHTALETTGCFDKERLTKLLPYTDQVLFDLKIMDADRSKAVIGADLAIIKANFETAVAASDVQVTPRVPLIPTFTTSTENLQAIADYLLEWNMTEVHLLPFHQYGSSKYGYLGWEYQLKDLPTLSKEEAAAMQALFEARGIRGNIDGLE